MTPVQMRRSSSGFAVVYTMDFARSWLEVVTSRFATCSAILPPWRMRDLDGKVADVRRIGRPSISLTSETSRSPSNKYTPPLQIRDSTHVRPSLPNKNLGTECSQLVDDKNPSEQTREEDTDNRLQLLQKANTEST